MFGGVGLYCDGLFFALLDDDRLYFKIDVVEDPDELRVWMDKALAVARRKKSGASARSRAGKGGRS